MMKTYDNKRRSRVQDKEPAHSDGEGDGDGDQLYDGSQLCRLCLSRSTRQQAIFAQGDGPPLSVRIMTCLQLEVVQGDGLPEMICEPCVSQLEKYYVFRKKCENSDTKLRKHLKKATETPEEDNIKSEKDLIGSKITFAVSEEDEIEEEEVVDNEEMNFHIEVEESKLQLQREINAESKDRNVNENREEIVENQTVKSGDDVSVRVLANIGDGTHVEVTTEDGSVFLMQLVTDDHEDEQNTSEEVQMDENGELCLLKCTQCDKCFARHVQLKRHMSTHNKQQGHTCEYCEKWFPSRSSLVKHERCHTGEKPFQCGICFKCFNQKEILYRHLFTHSDKKPFNCNTCGKGFTQRENLKTHMLNHMSPKPTLRVHKCPICPKVFCHSSGLSRHILIHTGKTYNCGTCKKSFHDKSTLRKHQKTTLHTDES